MTDDLRPPYRIAFDNARDPYTARNTLGIDSVLANYLTTADAAATYLTTVNAAATYATIANFPAGAWTAWTPTITSSTGTLTSTTVNVARYTKAGKTITAYFDITITNAGSAGGFIHISLPVPVAGATGQAFGNENTVVGKMLYGRFFVGVCGIVAYDGSTLCVTGYRVEGVMIYEST